MVYKRILIEHNIIIVTLKEEGKSLRKIRNVMLIRHGISVTIQGIRKIILKFQETSNYVGLLTSLCVQKELYAEFVEKYAFAFNKYCRIVQYDVKRSNVKKYREQDISKVRLT